MKWTRDGYELDTDRARLDVAAIHAFLADSYWARGIPLETVRRSIEHSLCFGLYHADAQAGFMRVITDHATFAYVGDVYVLDAHRGRGLARWMMQTALGHPDLQGFRRWVLLTRDAHRLYEGVGFRAIARPERYMELWNPDPYGAAAP